MKRIVSIVIVISVILGLQAAYAASDNKYADYSYEINVLSKIGVFDNIDYEHYGTNDYINYYDYMQKRQAAIFLLISELNLPRLLKWEDPVMRRI